MKKLKSILNHVFIDGLSGMASGLFATLIIGTILEQIAGLIGGAAGAYLTLIARAAMAMTGAGIGVGVAHKYGAPAFVTVSAAVCGTVGAYAGKILSGAFVSGASVVFTGPGEPLGAFIAAFAGIELGMLVSGRTKLDILVTPSVTIVSGAAVGLLLSPPISGFMTGLGAMVNWGTEQQPLLMGIVVSVLMGMILTLPISSAAIGIVLNLSGIAAGAAAAGCCANMIGFAVASFRENGFGGLVAQGLGTSMLQVPNIFRKPLIWLPAIFSSAILGVVSTCLLGMTNNSKGAGMGTAGLVGPLMAYKTMTAAQSPSVVLAEIVFMYFIAPAALSLIFSETMRRLGLIKFGDMKLDL
jgi:uncharacterized membrane protein